MAKLNWLENNHYLEQETGRQYGWAAWMLWGIALIILLVPVRGSVMAQYYINTAEDSPSIIGHVVQLTPSHRGKGLRGGKGGRYDARVEIEYKGETYNVTSVGFNFTHAMYEEAIESGKVPVYLNPERPEKSVLSKGVPFLQYFATGIFTALALFLIGAGCYFMNRRVRCSYND